MAIGTLVRVRTDIPKADHTGSPIINDSMQTLFGRIGIVCEVLQDRHRVFFNDMDDAWYWRNEWLTELSKEDESKMDAAWLKMLRDEFAKTYPAAAATTADKDDVELTQATKRIKKTITELRDTLATLDKEVDSLKK